MQSKNIILLFFLTLVTFGFSQKIELSPLSEISVLTCGPGDDLYTSFGHSAFRVQDRTLGIDAVYNYGTFDFNPPWFYLEFTQGKLIYSLGRQRMERFLAEYKYYDRWVKENKLNLSLEERNKLFQFLEHNYLPENRDYRYDFFYDNCATKIWDVLKENFNNKLTFSPNYIEEQYTFRELIHQNLEFNSWAAFGIDLALGSVIDKKATPQEHMYLPAYIMKQLTHATLNGKPLSEKTKVVFEPVRGNKNSIFFTSPLFWLNLILILGIALTYNDFRKKRRTKWFDFLLFFITGLAGLLLFHLWFLTEHTTTVGNFNLFWVFPLNLAVAFFMISKKPLPVWISKYLLLLLVLLGATILVWLLNIQVFSPMIIPLLILLAVRYLFLFQLSNRIKTSNNIPI
ncbi:DUF4105 domain-containing protein [uncultured Kriegella sp.]|uniref:lipoprotein N-acyltransferase Lnb domain-containing protein n=1 Tax=uncultured Kriegella sp. TaxID=1798910 RepID=UPI0030DB714A|tara:strand:- start:15333 stop:16529 length:1197 start_codon:yes stop_codon:yes gene_type:complete